MKAFVIDASIAIKWVIEEEGTAGALLLLKSARLIAPDLLVAECANILWKKVQRRELSAAEARMAARLLQAADIELVQSRSLLEASVDLAVALEHPAYDCLYLALAIERQCQFATGDERLLRKLASTKTSIPAGIGVPLSEAAAGV
jgi:predicted nucleic acid-binding protein